ncbi:MAG: response regulator [Anaerolinea sp.]|nr:response regulator [Anaerolinea sp.]MCC6972864.1 response regulator [Anaerolineae bacterium]CAG0958765.1 Cyclic di-GMP phosphodiesterase [Planctomycetaceae bacterium]
MAERRALIVDDDYANRSIWDLMLTDHGYDVVMASDRTTGAEQVSSDISLYLIDYHLPDGRGSEVTALARKQAPDAIVVMVSMDDDSDVIREAMHAGSNVFMVKPSSPSLIRELLNDIEGGQVNSTMRQLINRHGRRTYQG